MNDIQDQLHDFYTDVQREVKQLEVLFLGKLKCGPGCSSCCVDDITVFEIEAQNIRRHNPGLLKEKRQHPKGKCAFLDNSGYCRIYEHRPYVCRTQGLPLRWLEKQSDGSMADLRDICPLNDPEIRVESLKAESCWTIGKWEGRLANLQMSFDKGNMVRVPLRDLFEKDNR